MRKILSLCLLLAIAALPAVAQQQETPSVFMQPLTKADEPAPVIEVEDFVCLTREDLIFLEPKRWFRFEELPCIPKGTLIRLREKRQRQIEDDLRMKWTASRRMTGRDGAYAAVPFHVLAKGSAEA